MNKAKIFVFMFAMSMIVACNGNHSHPADEVVQDEEVVEEDSMEQAKKEQYEAIRKKVHASKDKSTDPNWKDEEQFSFNEPLDDKK